MTRRSAHFDINDILQRTPDDSGYVYPRVGTARARVATRRQHAMDEGPRDLDAAYRHLYGAMDHLHAARAGKVEFDAAIYDDHVAKAADCLKGGGEDQAAEKTDDDSTEAERERERAAAEAADGVGEVAPRSAVETAGTGNTDRKSPSGGTYKGGGRLGSASSIQGGADSALEDGFDFEALMQRV